MRVGFLVERIGYYRLFGPLIDEALRQGAQVFALHRDFEADKHGGKAYEYADPAKVPSFRFGRPVVLQWGSDDELFEICTGNKINVVVSQWVYPHVFEVCKQLRRSGVRWVSLQHSWEFLAVPFENFMLPDVTCMFSQYWVDMATRFFKADIPGYLRPGQMPQQLMSERTAITGFPELDQFHLVDRSAIRQKYGVPEGMPVVVLISYTLHSHNRWERLVFRQNSRWQALARVIRHGALKYLASVWRGTMYSRLLRAIKAFCDRNGAFLISKSRIKDRPPAVERELADYHAYDAAYYPHTIVELLSIADLCIHFFSTTALEAALAGAASLCLVPPMQYSQHYSVTANTLKYDVPGHLFNFDGVSYQMSVEEAIQALRDKSLDDFRLAPKSRRAFVEKFLGFDDYQSSSRVWKVIQQLSG